MRDESACPVCAFVHFVVGWYKTKHIDVNNKFSPKSETMKTNDERRRRKKSQSIASQPAGKQEGEERE